MKISKLDVAIEILLIPGVVCIFDNLTVLNERECPKNIFNPYAKCKACLKKFINEEFKRYRKEGFFSWEK